MKQRLAKSLLMAGAMIASYPLLAQQTVPTQQAQPMTAPQVAPDTQPGASGGYAAPAPVDLAQARTANSYTQGSVQGVQMGVPPAQGAASMQPPATMVDPPALRTPPDVLGSRLGRRSLFLDGA